MSRLFYGWRIVAVCLVAGVFANALGLFGAGVYLHELVVTRGWPTALVSGAITTFYVTSALLLIPVGGLIGRYGGRASIVTGAVALSAGVAVIGRVQAPWQAYVVFLVMGVGWACLSMTAVATMLAPWFERHQGARRLDGVAGRQCRWHDRRAGAALFHRADGLCDDDDRRSGGDADRAAAARLVRHAAATAGSRAPARWRDSGVGVEDGHGHPVGRAARR